MGHKIHPVGFRVGITRDWDSRWFAPKKQYGANVYEDYKIRKAIKTKYYSSGVSRIEVERAVAALKVIVYAQRPGQLIGRGGKGIEEITQMIARIVKPNSPETRVQVDIQDVRQPETDAQLLAENIATQLEKRISHRRAIRQTMTRAQRNSVKGIRVAVAGRLNGAEIARREWDRNGRVPLHTLRADIDFGQATAFTIFGTVGVKVWVYKGEVPRTRGFHESLRGVGDVDESRRTERTRAPKRSAGGRTKAEGGAPRPRRGAAAAPAEEAPATETAPMPEPVAEPTPVSEPSSE